MFFLISFVVANNYCIGKKTEDECKNICHDFLGKFDGFYENIPNNSELISNDDDIHNFYIADNVSYYNTKHNLYFCDQSIYLIYSNISKITIKDQIYVDSDKIGKNIPILFEIYKMYSNLYIDVATNDECDIMPFIIDFKYSYCRLMIRFLTESFPENLILISDDSEKAEIKDVTRNVKRLFKNPDKIQLSSRFIYYCISDKEDKCSDYKSDHKLEYLNSTLEISQYQNPIYIIVDTTEPQLFEKFQVFYVHIIAMPGSNITYHPFVLGFYNDMDVIIHEDSIEMTDFYFEGEGNFTLNMRFNFSLLVTAKTNKFHFELRQQNLFTTRCAHISAIRDDLVIELDEKIYVPEYSLFYGPKCLSGLFETGKYLSENEDFITYNVKSDSLKEYEFNDVIYYFAKGDHEVPKLWMNPSSFKAISPNETNITFNDVYSYDGHSINNFIHVNSDKEQHFNIINIKPAKYFYLSSFKNPEDFEFIEKYTIHVENDFVMTGEGPEWYYDLDEISPDQCRITGNGTISFINRTFMNVISELCTIDGNISFNLISNSSLPIINICIGQSDIETCKSKIINIESMRYFEWIWLRNIDTAYYLPNHNSIYITDKYILSNKVLTYDVILTKDSDFTIMYQLHPSVSIYSNEIRLSNIHIIADDISAKFTALNSYDNGYNFNYGTNVLYIAYNQPLTAFKFRYYLNIPNVRLYMKYIENITNAIQLEGKCIIEIREYYQSILDIFNCSDSVLFMSSYYNYFEQICYSDSPAECKNLHNFIHCKNYEEFVKADEDFYLSVTLLSVDAHLYKDISLDFDNNSYRIQDFYFHGNIKVNADLPDNALFTFKNNYHDILTDKDYHFYFSNNDIKFTFNIKENISLSHLYTGYYIPPIEFISTNDHLNIFPYESIKNQLKYKIIVSDDLTIYSPVPQYIEQLFDSHPIHYSPNWSYYYLSEEGKQLYGNHPSFPLENFDKNDDFPFNIVLAYGKNDAFSFPLDWTNAHNIYALNGKYDLNLDKPSDITYTTDGIIFNQKMKIVGGSVNVNVPNLFTLNLILPQSYYSWKYPYKAKLNVTENPQTDIHFGFVDVTLSYWERIIHFCNYNSKKNRVVTVHGSADNINDFIYLYTKENGISIVTNITYDYICYYPFSSPSSQCSGNYFYIRDVTNLYQAINDYPYLVIYLAYDIDIPYTTGDYYRLYPKDEKIQIDLPNSPESMTISKNNKIYFNYSDGTCYEILNKSIVNVELSDEFKLYVNSDTDSLIKFSLSSDVFISAEINFNASFNISVDKNSYHLYTDDINQFGNIFNDSLELYFRVCAYDTDAISLCSFQLNDKIENIFNEKFNYNEVEIALSTTPKEITVPSISYHVPVYIVPLSSTSLTLNSVSHISITKDTITINEFWDFKGDLGILRIRLNESATFSLTEEINVPIILELTSDHTSLYLRNCEKLNSSQITILRYGSLINEITVFGPNETFNNFLYNIVEHKGIKINYNGTQKYLCLCKNDVSCTECKAEINGIVETSNAIRVDPGEDVRIRVFSDFEISSSIFHNEHDVFIQDNCLLNLSDIAIVNQNIDYGLKVDNLLFVNGSNLLLKPTSISLDIEMRKEEIGDYFTIEMETFLRLNVTNAEEEGIKASRLHVNGYGELNSYDYPFERIRPSPTVKVIKGVYIICGVNDGNNICSYESVQKYKTLSIVNEFAPSFDKYSKILVFLDSYTTNLDVKINYLQNQKIQCIRNSQKKASLSEEKEPVKLRFLSTTEVINRADYTTGLSGDGGGAILDSSDSDLFIVGFDENLTIKQEGDLSSNATPITVQPMNEKVTIFIDESVDIEKQKLKIESENNKKVSVTVRTNKDISGDEILNKFIETDSTISVTFVDAKNFDSKKKGLPIGAIIGIVVAVVVLVAVVVAIVIFVVKKRNTDNVVLSDDKEELSDSTF